MARPIYLDHAATTPVRPEVLEAMLPFFGPRFGNPSSTHRWGREARVALDDARASVAACLGARPDEILFTSGGTESDNLAILGAWETVAAHTNRRLILTTPIEHKAVLAAAEAARDGNGAVHRSLPADEILSALNADVALCSVMWVNNELGTIHPIPELAHLANAHGVLFHSDAVQAFGKLPIDAKKDPFDLLSISGHKIGAPKGIGALYVRRGTHLSPRALGGAQERGLRGGTENVAFAVGFARAAELAIAKREVESARLRALRETLERELLSRITDAVVNGTDAPRASHITNLSFPGADRQALLMALDLAGIACSSGSACQSGSAAPSHVLMALGLTPELATSAIRLSLGSLTTPEDIAHVVEVFPGIVAKSRTLTPA
jgi:cysteine desulfurase